MMDVQPRSIVVRHAREDGSYVVSLDGMPYHVTPDDPLFAIVVEMAADAALETEQTMQFEPVISDVTSVMPADLWRRATDDEAEAIEAAMQSQPLRLRRIFQTATSYRSDDELWPLLLGVATELFGSERAEQLLARS